MNNSTLLSLIFCISLGAQLLAPTTALAHGGLAEALLITGFTVHVVAALVLTLIGTLIFGGNRKRRVFGLSFVTTFFAEILLMIIPLAIPPISDSGFIATYFITVIALSFFCTAIFGGAFKKRTSSTDLPMK